MGDARGNDSAVYFVLKKCANLDARQIAVVKRNKEELAKYVHEPTEGIYSTHRKLLHKLNSFCSKTCSHW